jgi:hypothetical protein
MSDLLGTGITVGKFYQYATVGDLCRRVRELPQRQDKVATKDYFISNTGSPTANDFSSYYRMKFGSVKAFRSEIVGLAGEVRLEVLHNIHKRKPPLILLPPMACLATVWLRQVRYFA